MNENESKTAAFTIPAFDYENATPEQANAELNRLNAEFGSSLDRHPFSQSTHPQRGDFIKHRELVMDAARRGMDTRPIPEQILQGVYDRGQARLAEKRGELIAEAKTEMAKLEELGFDCIEIPADLAEYHLTIWKMQRLNAEGTPQSLDELSGIMTREAQSLRAEPELAEAVRAFNQARSFLSRNTPDECRTIAESIIRIIYQANRLKYGQEA